MKLAGGINQKTTSPHAVKSLGRRPGEDREVECGCGFNSVLPR